MGIPPKPSILGGLSIINHPFWGTPIPGIWIWGSLLPAPNHTSEITRQKKYICSSEARWVSIPDHLAPPLNSWAQQFKFSEALRRSWLGAYWAQIPSIWMVLLWFFPIDIPIFGARHWGSYNPICPNDPHSFLVQTTPLKRSSPRARKAVRHC